MHPSAIGEEYFVHWGFAPICLPQFPEQLIKLNLFHKLTFSFGWISYLAILWRLKVLHWPFKVTIFGFIRILAKLNQLKRMWQALNLQRTLAPRWALLRWTLRPKVHSINGLVQMLRRLTITYFIRHLSISTSFHLRIYTIQLPMLFLKSIYFWLLLFNVHDRHTLLLSVQIESRGVLA